MWRTRKHPAKIQNYAMVKTIYIDINKVKTVADLKLLIHLDAGLSKTLGLNIKIACDNDNPITLNDTLKSMDHFIIHERTEERIRLPRVLLPAPPEGEI